MFGEGNRWTKLGRGRPGTAGASKAGCGQGCYQQQGISGTSGSTALSCNRAQTSQKDHRSKRASLSFFSQIPSCSRLALAAVAAVHRLSITVMPSRCRSSRPRWLAARGPTFLQKRVRYLNAAKCSAAHEVKRFIDALHSRATCKRRDDTYNAASSDKGGFVRPRSGVTKAHDEVGNDNRVDLILELGWLPVEG